MRCAFATPRLRSGAERPLGRRWGVFVWGGEIKRTHNCNKKGGKTVVKSTKGPFEWTRRASINGKLFGQKRTELEKAVFSRLD
jgi:hypothetical protein